MEVSGFYGWRINQSEETRELLGILEAGESVSREPVYLQTAASHDGPDYGSTYAEVNLTAQHLIFYKDGQKVLESDFVSGNVSRGHTTPPGIFSITYKQRDAVLKGEGYASPVKFWMPFNGGIGFHDASWRSSFGGSIYKNGGSHGCVNMPMTRQKSYLKMYMRACLLSVMTFREQRARNPASPPAGRPGRQRHLRSRRLYHTGPTGGPTVRFAGDCAVRNTAVRGSAA